MEKEGNSLIWCKAVPIYTCALLNYLVCSKKLTNLVLIPPFNCFRQLMISDADGCMILPD